MLLERHVVDELALVREPARSRSRLGERRVVIHPPAHPPTLAIERDTRYDNQLDRRQRDARRIRPRLAQPVACRHQLLAPCAVERQCAALGDSRIHDDEPVVPRILVDVAGLDLAPLRGVQRDDPPRRQPTQDRMEPVPDRLVRRAARLVAQRVTPRQQGPPGGGLATGTF